MSLDGHDKLCGYQNSTFPVCIYGCLDTFSRKILYLFVCYSNSDPRMIGKKYLEYLCREKIMPSFSRIDKGTETGKMATVHVYLINKFEVMDDPVEAVIYGPSTSNKIERWWRDLHERLENYFKIQLTQLLRDGQYDPHNILHTFIFPLFSANVISLCTSHLKSPYPPPRECAGHSLYPHVKVSDIPCHQRKTIW